MSQLGLPNVIDKLRETRLRLSIGINREVHVGVVEQQGVSMVEQDFEVIRETRAMQTTQVGATLHQQALGRRFRFRTLH